jgi:hypothetical protein
MRFDMVCDGRRRHATDFQAEPAQRLDAQLVPTPALPFAPIVPAMNVTFVRHGGTIPRWTFDRYRT